MKILIAGAGKPPAIERYFLDHLNELGANASLLPIQNVFFDYYEKNIFHKILFKAGASGIYKKINDIFRHRVELDKPDLIWVFKGMELFPETLLWAKQRGIRLVNYNTDNPFIFSGSGSGNNNVVASIGLYDLHLTYDRLVRDSIISQYKIQCEMLPFGFEDRADLYKQCKVQDEMIELCFVGSPDHTRAKFLERIAEYFPLVVFGPSWNKWVTHPSITIREAVHGDEFWKVLHRYRIQLNLMRPHNPDSHNMRSFEVPGIGGIMLAPNTTDHRQYFRENEEIFLYNTLEDCIDKIGGIISMDADSAKQVRHLARERSMNSGYSYLERTRTALSKFKQLL